MFGVIKGTLLGCRTGNEERGDRSGFYTVCGNTNEIIFGYKGEREIILNGNVVDSFLQILFI